MIIFELTETEREVLLEAIESYVSDLRMEIADTDSMDYREMLKARKDVLSRILEHLGTEEKTAVAERL
jgi:ribonuclease HII